MKLLLRNRCQEGTSTFPGTSAVEVRYLIKITSFCKDVIHPFITTKLTADKLGVAFTTAQRAIERLQRIGIVKLVGDAKRDRVFCAQALLDILEEPARLAPTRD